MNAKKCDRCGKLYEPEKEDRKRIEYKVVRITYKNSRYKKTLDFCPECEESLKEWFELPMF